MHNCFPIRSNSETSRRTKSYLEHGSLVSCKYIAQTHASYYIRLHNTYYYHHKMLNDYHNFLRFENAYSYLSSARSTLTVHETTLQLMRLIQCSFVIHT